MFIRKNLFLSFLFDNLFPQIFIIKLVIALQNTRETFNLKNIFEVNNDVEAVSWRCSVEQLF